MAEHIEIGQLCNCETCFHHQGGSCSPSWCDPCEGFPSVYVKLKKADVAPVLHGPMRIEVTTDDFVNRELAANRRNSKTAKDGE